LRSQKVVKAKNEHISLSRLLNSPLFVFKVAQLKTALLLSNADDILLLARSLSCLQQLLYIGYVKMNFSGWISLLMPASLLVYVLTLVSLPDVAILPL